MKWRAFGLLLLCIPPLATACSSSESAPLAPGTAAATVAVADVAKPTAPTGASPTRAASPLVSSTRSAAGAATPTAPRASPATASTPAATARPDTATPPSTGAVPTGWQTYDGGARVPFTIAYPPDWTVDDSRATQGRVSIYGPGVTQPFEDALWLLIATTGNPAPDANIDVLRDQYFATEIKDPHPEAGIDVTRRNEFSGLPFASLGTTFNSGTVLCYAYIGLAVRDGVPWRFPPQLAIRRLQRHPRRHLCPDDRRAAYLWESVVSGRRSAVGSIYLASTVAAREYPAAIAPLQTIAYALLLYSLPTADRRPPNVERR